MYQVQYHLPKNVIIDTIKRKKEYLCKSNKFFTLETTIYQQPYIFVHGLN